MRVIVVGMGVQGEKRATVAGDALAATVDPFQDGVDYKAVEDAPRESYDAALVCTPDEPKYDLLRYLLGNGKHVLVEKPLFMADAALKALRGLAVERGVVAYTAYNHRFEPHFIAMKQALDQNRIGQTFSCRMFYGNGTARLVRESAWRDQGAGVLPDLGSHLLDTILFWFGQPEGGFEIVSASRFENKAFDNVVFISRGRPLLHFEMTLLSWRNHFYADLYGSAGSAHIQSLCKWGPSIFTVRDRKIPAGRTRNPSRWFSRIRPGSRNMTISWRSAPTRRRTVLAISTMTSG